MNLKEINLSGYIKRACNNLGIKGDGVRESFTAHGLMVTAITNLFEEGFERN